MDRTNHVTEENRTDYDTTHRDFTDWQKGDTGTGNFLEGQIVAQRSISPDFNLFGSITTSCGYGDRDARSETTTETIFDSPTTDYEDISFNGPFWNVNASMGFQLHYMGVPVSFAIGGEYGKDRRNISGDTFGGGNIDKKTGKSQCERACLNLSMEINF